MANLVTLVKRGKHGSLKDFFQGDQKEFSSEFFQGGTVVEFFPEGQQWRNFIFATRN